MFISVEISIESLSDLCLKGILLFNLYLFFNDKGCNFFVLAAGLIFLNDVVLSETPFKKLLGLLVVIFKVPPIVPVHAGDHGH
jgi:hypothetical protein